ncbi:hypothetical protein ZWY2020_047095 [Hordeum vulgare]|nr:hypothetical protein ZWY2020_047095 [Hordeum vulgare]
MMPDNYLLLRESILTHQAPSLHCMKHHFTKEAAHWSLDPVHASRNDAPKEETTPTRHLGGTTSTSIAAHDDSPIWLFKMALTLQSNNNYAVGLNCSLVFSLLTSSLHRHHVVVLPEIFPNLSLLLAGSRCGRRHRAARVLNAEVPWCSSKQEVVATSTCEAEYITRMDLSAEKPALSRPSWAVSMANGRPAACAKSMVLGLRATSFSSTVVYSASEPNCLGPSRTFSLMWPQWCTSHGTGQDSITNYTFLDETTQNGKCPWSPGAFFTAALPSKL